MKDKKRTDSDLILYDIENVFGTIGNCLDNVLDEKKTKRQVVGGLFNISKSLIKLGVDGTKCIIKHTPKAIVTVTNAKRELTESITEEYSKYQKEMKEDALNEKIKKLKILHGD